MASESSLYQKELHNRLSNIFQELEVKNEWASFRGQLYQYSPRVDIAVGPFSITAGENISWQYDELLMEPQLDFFLRKAFEYHKINVDNHIYDQVVHQDFMALTHRNYNSRCLLAIEIENSNSKKHFMGSVLNAAALGRVGIGIAFNESSMRTFSRIINYLAFLKRVEKNTYDTTNFLLLSIEQLDEICSTLELQNRRSSIGNI